MDIRKATAADTEDLVDMIAALAAHHGDESVASAATVPRDLTGPGACGIAFLAFAPGPVGYAVLEPRVSLQNGRRGANLHHLYVAPEARGSGVGRALIAACKAEVTAQGGTFMVVGTHPDNQAAQAFYLREGFERRDNGGPLFRMSVGD